MNTNLSSLQKTTPVTLVGNPNLGGALITPTIKNGQPAVDLNGKEIGSMRLEQTTQSLNGSYLNERKRVAFISAPLETLNGILTGAKLVEGSTFGGKIAVKESLAPFWPNQTSKINPQTGEQIGVLVNGTFHPVYMKMEYTENMSEPDVFIRTPEQVVAWKTVYDTASLNTPAVTAPATTATIPGEPAGS